ncbi:hypothetical protein F4810DRAFT_699268 [Camillea tinctor]|nr:hypothetical protein F4810DRAFT_699268 [Camillea tinctor]
MAERLTLALPDSSGASNVDVHPPHPRAVELSPAFAQHHDIADIDLEMHIPYSTGQAPSDAFRPRPTNIPLDLWYQRNDGPWIPPGLRSGQGSTRASPNGPNLRGNALAFSGHRDSIVPSECDTVPPGVIPSDSGYGSYHPRHSVANGSICDEPFDRSQETQSLMGHSMNDVAFPPFSQKDDITQGNTWAHAQAHASEQSFPANPLIRCETCRKELRTESERKKHQQRHTKPHKCPIEDCARHKEGFSTTNDLDRHIRSVHPSEKASGNRYQCNIGMCKSKSKVWPRADNFKAHLKRVHREEPSDDSLQSADSDPSPPEGPSTIPGEESHSELSPYGTFPTEQSGYPSALWVCSQSSNFGLSHEPDMTNQPDRAQMEEASTFPAQSGDSSLLHMSNTNSELMVNEKSDNEFQNTHTELKARHVLSRRDQTGAIDSGQLKQQVMIHFSGNPTDVAKPTPQSHIRTNKSREPERCLSSPSTNIYSMKEKYGHQFEPNFKHSDIRRESESRKGTRTTSIAVDITDQSGLRKLLETLQDRGVLEELGYKREEIPRDGEASRESTSGSSRDHTHICTRCHKTFPRKCELKKHEKRHQKPYGCTFQGCNKRFGSKNDWKRHENSQHFMLELWRCDEKQKENPPATCGKNFRRKEGFKHHLENHHQIKVPEIVEEKLETCRLGRNCETRFWCGFCEATVEIKEKGIKAWTERFNHIDDHFSGRNDQEQREIGEWKNVDPAHPREDSPVLDSDDSSDANTAPSLEPSVTAKKRKSSTRSSRQKRKRGDGSAESSSKKTKQSSGPPLHHCCVCSNMFPIISRQCIMCEHKLCDNCSSSESPEESLQQPAK